MYLLFTLNILLNKYCNSHSSVLLKKLHQKTFIFICWYFNVANKNLHNQVIEKYLHFPCLLKYTTEHKRFSWIVLFIAQRSWYIAGSAHNMGKKSFLDWTEVWLINYKPRKIGHFIPVVIYRQIIHSVLSRLPTFQTKFDSLCAKGLKRGTKHIACAF